MMLVAIGDYFGFGVTMVLLMGIPAAGLVINIAEMQRKGLNRKAGWAACLFFITLLIQGTTVTLSEREAFSDPIEFWLLAGTGVLNVIGAMIALWAIWQIRRKHRWPRGRKRAIAVFWLNVMILLAMGAAFFLRTHPNIEQWIFG